MKKFLAAFVFCGVLFGSGCAQVRDFAGAVSRPFAEATQPDTRVLAAYGLIVIALEEAATIAENPNTPDSVVMALDRSVPVVVELADISRLTALEYRRAVFAYEEARASGSSDQVALLVAVTDRALHAHLAVRDLRQALTDLQAAMGGGYGSALAEQAGMSLERAERELGARSDSF